MDLGSYKENVTTSRAGKDGKITAAETKTKPACVVAHDGRCYSHFGKIIGLAILQSVNTKL